MNIVEYIKFQEALGKNILWWKNVPFSEYQHGFYWSLPRYKAYDLSVRDMKGFLNFKRLGAISITEFPTQHKVSLCLLQNAEYSIESLHKKKRNQTRRGLRECEIRRVDWDEMLHFGLLINREALIRQNRKSIGLGDSSWWERQCRISSQFSDIIAFGAYVDGNLASYVHVVLHEEILGSGDMLRVANIVHFMSGNKYLKNYPNEALIFSVTQQLIHVFGCQSIILGSGSDDINLLNWKRHMGYNTESKYYNIIFNPALHIVKYFVPKLRIWIDGSGL